MTQGPPAVDLLKVEAVSCPCGHLPAQHDRIATRHCEATLAGALQRTCLCPGADGAMVPGTARNYDRR